MMNKWVIFMFPTSAQKDDPRGLSQNDLTTDLSVMETETVDGNRVQRDSFLFADPTLSGPVLNVTKVS